MAEEPGRLQSIPRVTGVEHHCSDLPQNQDLTCFVVWPKIKKEENEIGIFKDWLLVLLISSIAFNFQFCWFYSIFCCLPVCFLLPCLGLNHSFLW